MSNGERNQTTNNNVSPEISVVMQHAHLQRHPEPPPPYSPIDPASDSPVTEQPTAQRTIILQPKFKDVPIHFCCPSCHKRGLTTVQFVNSHKTHMIAGFICGLTLWCMLCCLAAIPYLVPKFKKADHYCSSCNYYLGSYSKL